MKSRRLSSAVPRLAHLGGDTDSDSDSENITQRGGVAVSTKQRGGGMKKGGSRRRSSGVGGRTPNTGGRRRRSSVGLARSREALFGKDYTNLTAMNNEKAAEMYATAIKLSSENKITQKNAWSLHLIDNMDRPEMLGGIDENSGASSSRAKPMVNFQRASCTLDASVKIYGHRVDDVYSHSYKVLENLSRTDTNKTTDGSGEDENVDDDEAAVTGARSVSKKLGLAATLQKNVAVINMANVDLACDVDPMFHKMSQTFDEGGARGMLLHNLCVHNGCSIVLDSDVGADDEAAVSSTVSAAEADAAANHEVEALAVAEKQLERQTAADDEEEQEQEQHTPVEAQLVDVGSLSATLSKLCGDIGVELGALQLCPQLDHLYDEIDDYTGETAKRRSRTSSANDGPLSDGLVVAEEDDDDDDFEGHDEGDFVGGGYDSDQEAAAALQERQLCDSFRAGGDDGDDDVDDCGLFGDSAAASSGGGGQNTALSERLCSQQCMIDSDYAFFSATSLKSSAWAGAAHWKFNKRPAAAATATDGGAKQAPARKRRVKEPFKLDFTSGEPLPEDAFVLPKGNGKGRGKKRTKASAATQLSEAVLSKHAAGADALLLPMDAHVSTDDLGRLFMRPQAVSRRLMRSLRGSKVQQARSPTSAADADDDMFAGAGDFDDGGYDSDGDDDGGGGFMDVFDGDTGAAPTNVEQTSSQNFFEQDDFLSQNADGLVSANRMVSKVNVGYATVSKKVDVKRLKTSLWHHVGVATGAEKATAAAVADDGDDGQAAPAPDDEEAVTFTGTVGTVADRVPSNVTVPYYFICMLHLANEKGLAFEGNDSLDDFSIAGC